MPLQRSAGLETIAGLAEAIARTCPEAAEQAMQIAALARELDSGADVGTIRDVLEAETVDSDELSDSRARSTATEIADALKR
jgi:hypothetical protein